MQATERAHIVELRPYLDPQEFAKAFPFFLHVDGALNVVSAGASLAKAFARPLAGCALNDLFTVKRPNDCSTAQHLRQHEGLCVLHARTSPVLTLRGRIVPMEDGSLLFVTAPVVGRVEDIGSLGLGFNDFAMHDPLGEVLLINRAAQMTLADANRLADRLRVKTAQLNSIMELASNGVAYLSPLNQLEIVNGALAGMLGMGQADLLGRDLSWLDGCLAERMAADDPGRGLLGRMLAQAPLPSEPETLTLLHPVKRVLHLTVRGSPEGGCVLYFRDVTAETEIDRMKSEFLSTAAHELRTPMASVFGFSELLLKRSFPPERQREMLDTIHRQAGILIDLINELLDLARIEARRGKDFKRVAQPVAGIVEQAVRSLIVPGDARSVRMSVGCPEARLLADGSKLGQAVTNVLSNAYKYSPQGGDIDLRVYLRDPGSPEADEPGHHELVIEVQDCGIGMKPEQLERLFERFYRADPSGNIPGTGLGMCLVKEIVELHGGRVAVCSEFGRGTTVSLHLPLHED